MTVKYKMKMVLLLHGYKYCSNTRAIPATKIDHPVIVNKVTDVLFTDTLF